VTGEWPSPGEVLIGRDVADATGIGIGGSVALVVAGEDGKDDSTPAVVSGVLDTGDAEDGFVVMSSADLAALVPGDRGYDVVEYSVTVDADALADLAAGINAADGEVTAAPVKRLARSETTVLTTLSSLLLSVTLIVLALTMITVATTMMAVVAERRAEIGLKKALGAGDRAIAADFLGEGLLLGFAGGLLGGVLGLAFAQVVSLRVFGRGVQAEAWLVPAAVAVSMLVTAVACLLPVRRAADVEPAAVLREE
jgi:putative ABC transport system permease protein